MTKVAKIAVAIAISAASVTSAFAMDDIKKAYLDGISDTLKLFDQKKELADKEVILNGYAIVANVSKIPVSEIIKYEILATKLGLKPLLINNETLIFGIFDRKADAKAQLATLRQYTLSVAPKVRKFDGESAIATPVMKNYIPRLAVLVVEKDGGLKNIYGVGDCNIVNKVLTVNAYKKYYKDDINRLLRSARHSAIANKKKNRSADIRNFRNTKKHKNVWNENFGQLSKDISRYGVIKGNSLNLFGKTYRAGDQITKDYKIAAIIHDIVILKNIYTHTSKKVKAKG